VNVEPQGVMLKVVIVDDNRHFLNAARDVLQQEGVAVVGIAGTSAKARQLVAFLRPDLVLVDVDLGDESGFDLAQELSEAADAKVVLISAYPESDLADLIAASPALGFVSKSGLSASAVSSLLGIER
jgi:DNA-binding NarL/FixJ family response regulator